MDGVQLAMYYVNRGRDTGLTLPLRAGVGLPRLDGAKLVLVKADARSDRCSSQAAFNTLVDRDHVVAVVGAYESTVTLQALLAADRRRIPLVNESSTAPSLTEVDGDPRPPLKACKTMEPDPRPSPWFFRVGPNDTHAAELFSAFIEKVERRGTVRVRRAAILAENNDIFGNGGAAVTRKLAKGRGITLREFRYRTVLGSSAPLSDPDCTVKEFRLVGALRSRVRQIKRYDPDVVFAIGYQSDAIAAVQTMQKLGYVPPALLAYGGGFLDSTFISGVRIRNLTCGLPRANPAGIIARAAWSPDAAIHSETTRHVARLFQQRYKRPMTAKSAAGFTAMLTLAQAINNAGSRDSTKIQAALRALDVPADATIMPWSGIKFDARGQNVRAQFVLQQVLGGRYRIVYPDDISTRRAIWPLAKARN